MKRLTSLKSLAAAALVLGAFGAASAAHARSDVYLSIGVNAPCGYVQPCARVCAAAAGLRAAAAGVRAASQRVRASAIRVRASAIQARPARPVRRPRR